MDSTGAVLTVTPITKLQQQLVNQGPFAGLLAFMMVFGSVINHNATQSEVSVSSPASREAMCKNSTIEDVAKFISTLPNGLGFMTILIVIIFPLVPVIVNSKTKMWNEFKFELVKCHLVGQGSAFGVSELLKHVLITPSPNFLQMCNITSKECLNKTLLLDGLASSVLPLNEPFSNLSLCHSNSTSPRDFFNSLHHFPDKICCLIGASIVSFLATLYFWKRANAKGKSIYESHSIQQCLLIVFQIICITCILIYLYFLYNSFDATQMYGILIGGLIQLMIICSTLPKKDAI